MTNEAVQSTIDTPTPFVPSNALCLRAVATAVSKQTKYPNNNTPLVARVTYKFNPSEYVEYFIVELFEYRRMSRWYISKTQQEDVRYFEIQPGYDVKDLGPSATHELNATCLSPTDHPAVAILTPYIKGRNGPLDDRVMSEEELLDNISYWIGTDPVVTGPTRLLDLMKHLPGDLTVGQLCGLLKGSDQFTAMEALQILHIARLMTI